MPQFSTKIPPEMAGQRLDQALAALFPDYSRSRLQQWIKSGQATLNGQTAKPKDKLLGGEQINLCAETEAEGDWQAQAIPLDIVYEDEDVLIINKPAGLVVHPGAGNPDGTLINALLHHAPELQQLPRAGIVHRLDKDTSGLLAVARSLRAHTHLVEQLQARAFSREYRAVANGLLRGGGTVDAPLGRHPTQRVRMAVVAGGKPAITHYQVLETFRGHTDLRVRLETGRTHQIRVHMAYLKHPLIGDPLYGGRPKPPVGATPELLTLLQQFPRQALHAARLGLTHPHSGEYLEWRAELPEDMRDLLACLRADKAREAAI